MQNKPIKLEKKKKAKQSTLGLKQGIGERLKEKKEKEDEL